MSDKQNGNGTPVQAAGSPQGGAPAPEPLRFFGTTWVNHDNGYALRRVAASVGSLALAAVSCLVLRFAYDGLRIGGIGTFVTLLVTVMFAVCSALAFGHTWDGFRKRPDPDRQASLRGLLTIGFVGSLLAYFVRSLTEAPGEKLHRQEYETAVEQHAQRTSRRSGNPSKKRRRS
ncbi:EamA/RhaT family transporter [Streptomyces sp. enrichment culture]|uniref:EamA/RhaT family transporter n=1 Tax=Streptomyces sp. enrichment culture TaxID=1795815 RepID=UPI003F557610